MTAAPVQPYGARHDQVQDHHRHARRAHPRHHLHRPSAARPRPTRIGAHGWAVGAGFAAGTLIGAAAASNSYYVAPGYRECRYVDRLDRWGNLRTIKVCDVAPY